MTRIYLIRHAEAEGNLYRIAQGQYNSIITDRGWRQIRALERRFQDIHVDAVYASDLYRTCTTARAVYEPRGLELRTDPELRELNMGDWEDQTWGQVRRTQPGELDRFNRSDPTWTAPRGEGLGELGERVERALWAMDAQINASTESEGTSLSLLEGMSFGLPAVVSDIGGNPLLIQDGENGLVFPNRDSQALAGCVARLMDDPALLRRLGEGAKRSFEENYTGEIFAKHVEDVYRDVLKGVSHGTK